MRLHPSGHCASISHMPAAPNTMEKLLRRKKPLRRDVAIVFTDIEDSTRKNFEGGDRAWSILREEHFAIARRAIRTNKGALVKTIGDSVLAVFEDASEAAKFALDFQDKLRDWNKKRRKGPVVPVRIGVHAGRVDILKGDIFGN